MATDINVEKNIRSVLLHRLNETQNVMSFADFMRIALYDPIFGYYMREQSPFSHSGDFITAPIISPFFGRALANPIFSWMQQLPEDAHSIVELGAGTGALAASLLPELVNKMAEKGQVLKHYVILELSASRRVEQEAMLKESLEPEIFNCICWWNQLPSEWSGILLANEVLDAIPFHRVGWSKGQYWEIGVSANSDPMQEWQEASRALDGSRGYDAELLKNAQRYIPALEGYISEIHLEAEGLVRSLAQLIKQGMMLWIDYGFDTATYYHPERSQGTFRIHQHHQSHDAWWSSVGEVDITTHVNFEAIAEVALEEGWQCEGYTTQARFLLGAGLMNLIEALQHQSAEAAKIHVRQMQPIHQLLSPAEMGELFKMVVLSRGLSTGLWVPGVEDVGI
ncbi:MAG: SAM-dependent methyltransferase [Pseudomonadota bacterium]